VELHCNYSGRKLGLKKVNGIEEVVNRIRKLGREVEGRVDKGNVLKSKTTWDCYLLL